MTIEELFEIIKERKKNLPKDSYIASLFKNGEDRIIQKVGEESIEVVIAAKNNNKKLLKGEIADLLFHLLVLLAAKNIKPEDIFMELENRRKK
ncbi:MAG TPA: phosphoribosyl-ATP diphosphatase [Candidatus Saccharimonadales bacterium]|nr:phosphoribosyl-ATP diphosphatase [Candidatus Saccharimonadales bacterium]